MCREQLLLLWKGNANQIPRIEEGIPELYRNEVWREWETISTTKQTGYYGNGSTSVVRNGRTFQSVRLHGTTGLEGRSNVLSEVQDESGIKFEYDLFAAVVVVSHYIKEQD